MLGQNASYGPGMGMPPYGYGAGGYPPYVDNGMMGAQTGSGYQYRGSGQPRKQPNVLTNEQIQNLLKKDNQFSLQITETERQKAICNHRTADGMGDALVEDADGFCVCQICGYKFLPLDPSVSSFEQIQAATYNLLDVLQTIKLIYIDIPEKASKEFFQIIALINKIPKLYEYAVKNYASHEQVDPFGYNSRGMGSLNLFNMLVGGPQVQQPNMQYQSNGFGYYGAPQDQGYRPGTDPGYSYAPGQPMVQPSAEAVPAAQPQSTAITETDKDTNVQVSFKA